MKNTHASASWLMVVLFLSAGACNKSEKITTPVSTDDTQEIFDTTIDTTIDTAVDTTPDPIEDSASERPTPTDSSSETESGSDNNLTPEQEAFYSLEIAAVPNDIQSIAEWYCANTGGEYYMDQSVPVSPHRCRLSNGSECELVQYYLGACAPEQSVCAKQGYELVVEEGVENPYNHQYWISCIVDNEKVSVFSLPTTTP